MRDRLVNLPLVWATRRQASSTKLKNFPHMQKFMAGLVEVLDEFPETIYERISHINYTNLRYHKQLGTAGLLISEGSPNFEMFTLTQNGYYSITSCPHMGLWRNHPIDPNILDIFAKFSNNKYVQTDTVLEIGRSYNLFLMQMAATKDYGNTLRAFYAIRDYPKFTVFKTHPTPGDGTDFNALWKYRFEHLGLVNENTAMVSDCNVDHLIRGADLVYSSDSAATFNALIYGKPVATYREMYLSEVVPLITDNKQLIDLQPPPKEDVLRFLSWYYHKVVIDITRPDFKDKIRTIVTAYSDGKSFEETFG